MTSTAARGRGAEVLGQQQRRPHQRQHRLQQLELRDPRDAVELTHVPSGGLHLWVRLPAEVDEIDLVIRARKKDVVIEPGHPYFATEPPGPHLRLTYAAATPAELTEATRRLGGELP